MDLSIGKSKTDALPGDGTTTLDPRTICNIQYDKFHGNYRK